MDHSNEVEAVAAGEHGAGTEHTGPGWSVYWKVAVILTLITVGEVWVYYIPAFVASRLFLPTLLTLSAVKFVIVVMFYMHLKYDSKLFRILFTGPVIVATATLFALLFLFGHIRLGHGG